MGPLLQGLRQRLDPPGQAGEAGRLAKLRQLDNVAYIRFASVYRAFADLSSFEEEIDRARRAALEGLDTNGVASLTAVEPPIVPRPLVRGRRRSPAEAG